jgi:hypothetical protein
MLKTLVFTPINNATTIGATHQAIASNQLIEFLWWNTHVTRLANPFDNRANGKALFMLPKNIVPF